MWYTCCRYDVNAFIIVWNCLLLLDAFIAQVSLSGDVCVSGGGLDGEYCVEQFHFHWGSVDACGSEHTINHQAFPLEVGTMEVVCM